MKNACLVLTDSGGIQEETTCLAVACVTIRENTERPVSVKDGTNLIAGTSVSGIREHEERQWHDAIAQLSHPRDKAGNFGEQLVPT